MSSVPSDTSRARPASPARRSIAFVVTVLGAVLLWRLTGSAITWATWLSAVLIAAVGDVLDARRRRTGGRAARAQATAV
jgi:hypothetical protein